MSRALRCASGASSPERGTDGRADCRNRTQIPHDHRLGLRRVRLLAQGRINHSHYSEITGYLWTDENLMVGGHDLLDELRSHKGSFVHLEIAYSKDVPDAKP